MRYGESLFEWRSMMKIILPLVLMSFLLMGCSDEPDEPVKYQFSSKDEYLKYYLPLQDDHGGIKKWVPAMDPDCDGGKEFTHAMDSSPPSARPMGMKICLNYRVGVEPKAASLGSTEKNIRYLVAVAFIAI